MLSSGKCTAVSHSDGDPIYMRSQIAHSPKLNLTIEYTDVQATYYEPEIESFYLNRDNRRLVLSVAYSGLGMDSPCAYFQLFQRGQEPLQVYDYLKVTYDATLTAYVTWKEEFTPADVVVSAYVKNPYPCYDIGPKIMQNPDPRVQQAVQQFIAEQPTVVQEVFLTKAYYYFFGWLQNYVCDFGYKYSGDINK
ncbi:hypothetical protein ABMA27_013615 [Loxostege sticticalis]